MLESINRFLVRVCAGCVLFFLSFCSIAADFALQDMQGKVHHLSDYRGKWVLVNYWATWCPPCLNEIPELNRLSAAHTDLVVIGIVMDYSSVQSVADAVKKLNIRYPVVLGNRKVVSQIGDLDVLPTSYLYDPHGKQITSHQGEVTRESVEHYIRRVN